MDSSVDFICDNINSTFKSSFFPAYLMSLDVTPLYKKGKKGLKEKYRSVSILCSVSMTGPCLNKCQHFGEPFIDATM